MKINNHFKMGMIDSMPIVISFLFVFFSIGDLYYERGTGFIETVAGTSFIFAAPLQVAIVDFLPKEQFSALLVITLIINFRFILMAMTTSPYFKEVSRSSIFLSLLMFSASTYAVSHAHFLAYRFSNSHDRYHYYLGVSIPSYLGAILATTIGYFIGNILDYTTVAIFIVMILPVHFTALTAKNANNKIAQLTTVLGGFLAPFFVDLNNPWITISLPIISGIVLASIETKLKGSI